MDSDKFVELKLYDELGCEITTLVNTIQPSGVYEVEVNAEELNLSSGIYFYRLQVGKTFINRKFVLLR